MLREMKVSAHPLAVSKAPALSQHRGEHRDKHRAEVLQPQTPVLLLQHQARLRAPPHQPSMPQVHCSSPLDFSGRGLLLPNIQLSPSRAGLMRRHRTPHRQSPSRGDKILSAWLECLPADQHDPKAQSHLKDVPLASKHL